MRNVILTACLALLHSGVGQTQTMTDPPDPPEHLSPAPPPCSGCLLDKESAGVTAQQASVASSLELSPPPQSDIPDAPSARLSPSSVPLEWNLGQPTERPTTAPPRHPVWDKKMWVAHIVYAGSTIFDVEVTHQGLASHRCVEGNIELGTNPTRRALYLDNFLTEFVPETFFDWITAAGARASHLPRWYWKPVGYIGATAGTIIHVRGGIQWFTHGCM